MFDCIYEYLWSCELFSRKVVIWQKVEAVGSVTNSRLLRATGVSFYGSLSADVHLS